MEKLGLSDIVYSVYKQELPALQSKHYCSWGQNLGQ